jgi:hypothetical protein
MGLLCINNLRVLFPNAMMTPFSPFSCSDPRAACVLRDSYHDAAAAVALRGDGHAKKMKLPAIAWNKELTDKEKQLCNQIYYLNRR